MPIVDLVMPKMGESIIEATILKWHKKPGDSIKQDETLLEIATDKVDTEVPSTAEGVVDEILFSENDVVAVGTVIAKIKVAESAQENGLPMMPQSGAPKEEISNKRSVEEPVSSVPIRESVLAGASLRPAATNGTSNRFYSPLVLNIASNEGIGLAELEGIHGSGNEGRVTKKDILQYVAARKSGILFTKSEAASSPIPAPSIQQPSIAEIRPQPITYSGNTEIIEMDRMRKLIAEHMVRSKHTSPHVTSFTEADVTNLVLWRERIKVDFEKREGTKITFTPLFIEAVIRCIKKYPMVNSSVEGDKIILKRDIHMGMATALPNGNLIVPVIRNADQFNLVGLTKQVNQLADNARNNRLRPEDTQGGTFTMTNVGVFGSLMGTPIINQPQVAILAVGAIKKRPMVIESDQGDAIAIRHMMYLSLSYDHRIVDGSLGATFLSEIARELENFNTAREF